ncbi:hypothetical protein Glove_225g53 [Diversispora epigaea]|uniref:Uncharacterized protein n=1 Tax=Diversispora epigaea TaxID=1348612 RepID=A0A397IHN4_9GLOM|nr:hypothetical protein Glove_225g53 [Diversispora epigaea]
MQIHCKKVCRSCPDLEPIIFLEKQMEFKRKYFASPKIVPGFENLHSDIVIIPGFKGSKLHDTVTKTSGWLELQTPLLPYSRENIDLPLEIEKNEEHRLVPGGLFSKILWMKFYDSLIKYLENLEIKYNNNNNNNNNNNTTKNNKDLQESLDAMGDILDALDDKENFEEQTNSKSPLRFHKFSYDWRRSNEASVERFLEFLTEIYNNNNNNPIYVIAHSNGGLITLSTLHQAPHLIAGAIFAGTPFHGAPGIFRDIKFGSNILFNKKLQDDAAFLTFRTVFGFIPWNKVIFKDIETAENVHVDCFDINEWLRNDWINTIHKDNSRYLELGSKEKRIEYLKRTLENTKKFHETLKFRKDFKYPPLVTLASGNYPTNGGYMVEREDNNKIKIKYGKAISVNGDGAVPVESAKLPEGIPYKIIFTERPHGELLEDLTAVGKALSMLFFEDN